MVSNRTARKARDLMAADPTIRKYQQALDRVRSESAYRPAHPDFFAALGIEDIASYDPRSTWKANQSDSQFRLPLGYDAESPLAADPALVSVDIGGRSRVRAGWHGCVQGVTGSGRSMLLAGMVLGGAVRYGPAQLNYLLVDSKGEATFRGFEALPHVIANIGGLERNPALFDDLVEMVENEIRRREELFAHHAVTSPDAYPVAPDLFIVLDEVGGIIAAHPDGLKWLNRIAAVGPARGIHLIVCSQGFDTPKIGEIIGDLGFGISLKSRTAEQSRAVLHSDAAVDLPIATGAALLRQENCDKLTELRAHDISARIRGVEGPGPRQRDALVGRLAQFPVR